MSSHNLNYNLRPRKVCKVVKRKKLSEADKIQAARKPRVTAALRVYNELMGTNYVFEEAWKIKSAPYPRSTCLVLHINFVARNKDVAHAPPEMFFAEITEVSRKNIVQLCVPLGPVDSDSLPEGSNYGCLYCPPSDVIRHPKVAGWSKNYYLNPPSLE